MPPIPTNAIIIETGLLFISPWLRGLVYCHGAVLLLYRFMVALLIYSSRPQGGTKIKQQNN